MEKQEEFLMYEKFEEIYLKGETNEQRKTSVITEIIKQIKPGMIFT